MSKQQPKGSGPSHYVRARDDRTAELCRAVQKTNPSLFRGHYQAMGGHDPYGGATHSDAIAAMVRALEIYAEATERVYGSRIGDDAVLGESWLSIARGVIGLLNGNIGALDAGTIDATVRDYARLAGFDPEEL